MPFICVIFFKSAIIKPDVLLVRLKNMKFVMYLAFGLLALFPAAVQAGTYLDGQGNPLTVGFNDCIMVDTMAEADTTHIYTLNPDNTNNLDLYYNRYWGRSARCDELQFHIDHNTPIYRLRDWLNGVANSWYQNIGATHYNHQTVSTARHEWFYIDENGAHRIPDWLTAMSWGLLIKDRLSIPIDVTDLFYNNVTFTAPMQFNDGQFADEIYSLWKENNPDYSTLPKTMQTEIDGFIDGSSSMFDAGIFRDCSLAWPRGAYQDLLDWRWMLSNPGCSLSEIPANIFQGISFTADSDVLGETSSYYFMVEVGEDNDTGGAFEIGFESFGTCPSDDADDCIVSFNSSRKGISDITAPLTIHSKTGFAFYIEEVTADTHAITLHGIANPAVSAGPYRAYLEFADGSVVPAYSHNRIYSDPFYFSTE